MSTWHVPIPALLLTPISQRHNFFVRNMSYLNGHHSELQSAPIDPTLTTALASLTLHATDSPSQSPNSTSSPFPYLPIEIVHHILKLGLYSDDKDLICALSQVCPWTHRQGKQLRFTTLGPITVNKLYCIPEHLIDCMKNIWIAEEVGEVEQDIWVRAGWIWEFAQSVAMPARMINQVLSIFYWQERCDTFVRVFCRGSFKCERLTLTGPGLGISCVFPSYPLFANVTHLRVLDIGYPQQDSIMTACVQLVRLLQIRMPSVKYLAVPYCPRDEPHAGIRDTVHIWKWLLATAATGSPPHDELVAIVMVIDYSLAKPQYVARADADAMRHDRRLLVVPAACDEEGVHREWEAALRGEEDIWQKAARLRKAVMAKDHESVKRM